MTRRTGVVAVVVLLSLPSLAEARGRPRGGSVKSPFGELYNTNSPEWRASGGNPLMFEQLRQQKMLMQQQQMMLKQQQQYQKSVNGKKSNMPGVNSPAPGGSGFGNPGSLPALSPSNRKKKRRTYVPTGNTADRPRDSASTPMPDPLKAATPRSTTRPSNPPK